MHDLMFIIVQEPSKKQSAHEFLSLLVKFCISRSNQSIYISSCPHYLLKEMYVC